MKKKDSNLGKSDSAMDVSPMLKEIYPPLKQKKTKSKRFGRIQRLLDPETAFRPDKRK
jgi:hypothetical protein